MNQLGGIAINLNRGDTQLGARRADRGRRARHLADGRRRDDPHVRAGDHRALRRALARAGDQRPDQRIPPVPDPRRHLHLHRASRLDRAARRSPGSATRNNVCNTWLQAADDLRLQRARLDAARLRSRRRARRRRRDGHYESFDDPMDAVPRRRPRHDRRVDQHGLRGRERRRASATSRDWQRRRRDDARGASPTRCSCTACPRIAARKSPPR